MFGVGPQEIIVIVVLLLVLFGPVKAASAARDLGRFANEARGQLEEFKSELTLSGEDQEKDRRPRETGARGRGGDTPAGATGPERGGAPGGEGARSSGPAPRRPTERSHANPGE